MVRRHRRLARVTQDRIFGEARRAELGPAGARIGTSIPGASSGGPASTSSTDTDGSADRRAAITHPAEPAPTMT